MIGEHFRFIRSFFLAVIGHSLIARGKFCERESLCLPRFKSLFYLCKRATPEGSCSSVAAGFSQIVRELIRR